MSAQLASQAELTNRFSAHLVLAAGVTASIHALSLADLQAVVAKLQPTTAANDAPKPAIEQQKPAATPAPAAAAAGNASASTGTQASAQGAGAGSAATGGDAPKYTYQDIATRITTLCKKTGGRDKCMALLKSFTGQNGQPADHGNKLKLEDYPAFTQKIDAEIGSAA